MEQLRHVEAERDTLLAREQQHSIVSQKLLADTQTDCRKLKDELVDERRLSSFLRNQLQGGQNYRDAGSAWKLGPSGTLSDVSTCVPMSISSKSVAEPLPAEPLPLAW